jgi:hypothetical protein
MKNKIFIIFLLFGVVSLTYIYKNRKKQEIIKEPPTIQENTFENSLESITEKSCRENLEFLSSDELEGRMSGKKGNVLAFNFIKQELEKYGIKTLTQKFKINRTNNGPENETGDDFTQNVYGFIEGKSLPNEIVVVGAHFDHIGYGPRYSRSNRIKVHNGADDNASGTVSVLEIAKAMSTLNPKRTVVFQFYSGEEMGLLGSRFYCENPLFPLESPDIKKHIAMINLDMVGHLESSYEISLFDSSIDLQKNIEILNEKYKFAKKITGRKSGGSDHASFYNKRIPVAFIHTGTHKYYHTPEDDPHTINFKGLTEISKYAFELAWNLANGEKPDFNQASFKEMPYTHDHGQISFGR